MTSKLYYSKQVHTILSDIIQFGNESPPDNEIHLIGEMIK